MGHDFADVDVRIQRGYADSKRSIDPTPPFLALKQLATLPDRTNLMVDAMQEPAQDVYRSDVGMGRKDPEIVVRNRRP